VLFRIKSRKLDVRLSVKVVTNCRVPGEKNPVQIHLGYLSPRYVTAEGKIPQGQRDKLLTKLQEKWRLYFEDESVDIDWDDAEGKWSQLRSRLK
jgi:hypothetical protein